MAQESNVKKFTLQAVGGAVIDFPVLPVYDSYDVGFKIVTRSWRDMTGTMHQTPICVQDVVKGTFICSETLASELRGYIYNSVRSGQTFFNLNYYSPANKYKEKTGWYSGLFYLAAENSVKVLSPMGKSMTGKQVQFDLEFIEVDGVKL